MTRTKNDKPAVNIDNMIDGGDESSDILDGMMTPTSSSKSLIAVNQAHHDTLAWLADKEKMRVDAEYDDGLLGCTIKESTTFWKQLRKKDTNRLKMEIDDMAAWEKDNAKMLKDSQYDQGLSGTTVDESASYWKERIEKNKKEVIEDAMAAWAWMVDNAKMQADFQRDQGISGSTMEESSAFWKKNR